MDLALVGPAPEQQDDEDSWNLTVLREAVGMLGESINLPTLVLMQAAFLLGNMGEQQLEVEREGALEPGTKENPNFRPGSPGFKPGFSPPPGC